MTNKKSTKKALLMSVLSLLLCFSMLVGTTFAWFTDSVESGKNIIAAGNLDVELNHADKGTANVLSEVNGTTPLFDDVVLWEPGAVVYETLQVVNAGTLALKYNLTLNVLSETVVDGNKLSDVIMVGVVDGALTTDTTREGLVNAVSEWTPLSAFSLKQNGVKLEVGGEDTLTVVLYWAPNTAEIDNKYNVKNEALNLEIGVTLTATQVEAESDSFNDKYDEGAKVPNSSTTTSYTTANSDGSASMTVMDAPATESKRTSVDAPAGAFNAGDKVEVAVTTTNSLFNVTANGGVVAALDVVMKVNDQETHGDLTSGVYTVTTYISKGLTEVAVAYTGTDGKDQPTLVSYDPETGKLVFTTNHFSEYAVSGKALAYDAANDTAVNDVEEIVEAAKDNNTTVIIPEENKAVVAEEIKTAVANGTITESDADVADKIMNVAQIGETTYASLAEALAAANDGETITLLKNVQMSADKTIFVTKKITLDLNGYTIAGISNKTDSNRNLFSVEKNGVLTVKNGVITVEHVGNNMGWSSSTNVFNVTAGGVLNISNATIENLGGSDMAFGVHLNNWGEVTLNVENSTIKSTYCAIRVFNSGNDMNNVTIKNSTIHTEGNRAFWVHNYTGDNALLNFDIFGNGNTYVAKTNTLGAPIRYGFDKPVYYTADGAVVVTTADELIAALAAGKNVVFGNDITMKAAGSNAYGKTGITVNGQVLDGNGYTLKVTGAGGTWDSAIFIKSGTVKNITVAGPMRGIFTSDSANGDIYLNNVTFSDVVYTFNSDGTSKTREGGVYITNCNMNGWTSFSDTHTEVVFTNCSFAKGSGYQFARPYNATQFVNCSFAENFTMDPRAAVTFENCTLNGVALTADNLATLVTSKIQNATVK